MRASRGLLLGIVVGWGLLMTGIWYLYPVNNQSSSSNSEQAVHEINQRLNLHQQLITDLHTEMKILNSMQTPHHAEFGKIKSSIDQQQHIPETTPPAPPTPKIAVLMIACNRETVSRAIDSILECQGWSSDQYPLIVSQDCNHQRTADVIRQYGDKLTHIKHPDQSDISVPANQRKFKGYYKISRHYKWALTQVFDIMGHQNVVIVEDDLEVAPDFFHYMSAGLRLLQQDHTLWCVSAWNDNGKEGLIHQYPADIFYRTDFFPGLGWMMTADVWNELKPKWPSSFWDDWMREPEQRKDRACIRPEISRSKTFGKKGVSQGQFYEQHLKYIVLNNRPITSSQVDISHLVKDEYERSFVSRVLSLPVSSRWDTLNGGGEGEVRVEYTSGRDFQNVAKQFKIMNDLKAKVPRTAYKGIVSFMYKGHRVHLTPPLPWRGY